VSTPDLSKASCPPFFRKRKPKKSKPSAELKRERAEPGYLTKIRALPCCVCGEPPRSHAHHLKCTGERGIGMKSSNKWAVPLCHECHMYGVERVGSTKEAAWFLEKGIYCLDLAASLHANSHSVEAMAKVLIAHKGDK
jgi:hypothetical protein